MENSDRYRMMEPTYGELANVLLKLNFVNKSTSDYFIYYNQEFDALVACYFKPGDKKMDKGRYNAIVRNLVNLGVIKQSYDLGKMIEQYRLNEGKVAA